MTPAPLRDRKAVVVGSWPEPALGRALMAQFLGPRPLDPAAKQLVGQALVFLANGFECAPASAARHPPPFPSLPPHPVTGFSCHACESECTGEACVTNFEFASAES